jgi:hypothetical protein
MSQDQFYRNVIQLLRQLRIPFVDPCDSNYTGDCICGSTGPVLNGLFSTENNDLPIEVSSFRMPNQLSIIGGTSNSQLVFEEFVDWGVFAENFELEGSNNVTINSGNTMDLVSPTFLKLNSPILRLNDTNMPTSQPVDESLPPGTYLRVVDQDGELAGTGGWLSTDDIGGNGIYGGSGVVPEGTEVTLQRIDFLPSIGNGIFSVYEEQDYFALNYSSASGDLETVAYFYVTPNGGSQIRAVGPESESQLDVTVGFAGISTGKTSITTNPEYLQIQINSAYGEEGQVLAADGQGNTVWQDAKPYKVYTALLTQSSNNAPVATVLENTLGGVPVWSRSSQGVYKATLANAFPENKTFLTLTNPGDEEGFGTYQIGLSKDTSSTISLEVSSAGSGEELGTLGAVLPISIEIRVYP